MRRLRHTLADDWSFQVTAWTQANARIDHGNLVSTDRPNQWATQQYTTGSTAVLRALSMQSFLSALLHCLTTLSLVSCLPSRLPSTMSSSRQLCLMSWQKHRQYRSSVNWQFCYTAEPLSRIQSVLSLMRRQARIVRHTSSWCLLTFIFISNLPSL